MIGKEEYGEVEGHYPKNTSSSVKHGGHGGHTCLPDDVVFFGFSINGSQRKWAYC